MHSELWCKTYTAPLIDEREILRYAGCKGEKDSSIEQLLAECLQESQGVFSYRACGRLFDVKQQDGELYIGAMSVKSQALVAHLQGCDKAVVFAATVGLGIDRLIAKYAEVFTAKAYMLQAIGAERIEALCDEVCKELTEFGNTKTRFSPGYGDFPLEKQKEIFEMLDCYKKIGLSLNDSLLMSPTKSVTAIVGIEKV